MEKGNPMKDGEQFDPDRARYGDVFLYYPPGHIAHGKVLTYVGVAPYRRHPDRVYVFQTSTPDARVITHRSNTPRDMRFSVQHTEDRKPYIQQGEATMNETTTVKSILTGSRTVDPNIAAIMRDDARTVDIKLNGVSDNLTYVTNLELELDDYVVVPNAKGNGFNVGVVAGVHDDLQIPPNSDIFYKWVVAKLDLTGYLANIERNGVIEQSVAYAYKSNARQSMRAAVMAGMPQDKLDILQAAIYGTLAIRAPE